VANCRVVSHQSPYAGLPEERWLARTEELLADYPAQQGELVDVVLGEWESIFESRLGKLGLRIGEHIFPQPQIMAHYLHEFIPYDLQTRHPGQWRRDSTGADKDLVYVPDNYWSTEIKTSSDRRQVFGNRSYGQPSPDQKKYKKYKSGFYLTVNFEKWSDVMGRLPRVRIIRLGWLDHTDWIPQKSPTGQQSKIKPAAYEGKLVVLFKA
jgi:ScaI restriction endonuclease